MTAATAERTKLRTVTTTATLEQLVGAHPDALRDIYRASQASDSTQLGRSRPGRFLAFEPLAPVFVLTRPIVRFASRLQPWGGKDFESGGTSGRNLVWGQPRWRFRCELAGSEIDGAEALVMRYDGFGHGWPTEELVEELRHTPSGHHLGVTFYRTTPLFWWGIE